MGATQTLAAVKWRIINTVTRRVLAEVDAGSEHQALDAMAKQAGFPSYVFAACSLKCPAGWDSVMVIRCDVSDNQ